MSYVYCSSVGSCPNRLAFFRWTNSVSKAVANYCESCHDFCNPGAWHWNNWTIEPIQRNYRCDDCTQFTAMLYYMKDGSPYFTCGAHLTPTSAFRMPKLQGSIVASKPAQHPCNCSMQVVMTRGCLCGGI